MNHNTSCADEEAPPPYSPVDVNQTYSSAHVAFPTPQHYDRHSQPAAVSFPQPNLAGCSAPAAPVYPQIPYPSSTSAVIPQPQYHTFQQPQQQHYQHCCHHNYDVENAPLLASEPEPRHRRFPIGAIIFLFGWFFPPLWVIGGCCCSGSNNPYEAWWGKLNFIMAAIVIISSIVCFPIM